MANEAGGVNMDGVNEWWWIRQDVNKITEEAVKRIQDDQKKAKQVGQQIKADKATNGQFAQFLEFLLRNISNEKLIQSLYEVFFKTKHPKTQITYLRKNVNTIVIVGMFVPFHPKEVKEYWLEGHFQKLYEIGTPPTLTWYVQYLKALSKTYHDNIPIDRNNFITFLIEMLGEYKMVSKIKLDDNEQKELKLSLTKELYGK